MPTMPNESSKFFTCRIVAVVPVPTDRRKRSPSVELYPDIMLIELDGPARLVERGIYVYQHIVSFKISIKLKMPLVVGLDFSIHQSAESVRRAGDQLKDL